MGPRRRTLKVANSLVSMVTVAIVLSLGGFVLWSAAEGNRNEVTQADPSNMPWIGYWKGTTSFKTLDLGPADLVYEGKAVFTTWQGPKEGRWRFANNRLTVRFDGVKQKMSLGYLAGKRDEYLAPTPISRAPLGECFIRSVEAEQESHETMKHDPARP